MVNKENILKVTFLFLASLIIIVACATLLPDEMAVMTTKESLLGNEKLLIPGGDSVGLQMKVKGVLVVALEDIETENSIEAPALESGVQVGDLVLSIDGISVSEASDVGKIVNASSSSHVFLVELSRKKEVFTVKVKPVVDVKDSKLKLGMWVKEKIAGIGTLTFVDLEKNVYGALGHGIYERETKQLLGVKEGSLLRTRVKSVKEGNPGEPGAITGVFLSDEEPIGSLVTNTESGIYGKYRGDHARLHSPIPIGKKLDVKKGNAYIYTTVMGSKVEKFQIEIKKVHRFRSDASKGLEIKVVDKRLLGLSGGIVQGMSGSPIIQNGKLVGAVTHVFVNDPTRGYGVFIEEMLETAEDIEK